LIQQENVCVQDAVGGTMGLTTGCIMYTDIFLLDQTAVQLVG